ncbi:MAG TPA: amino acid permease [Candidatus Baltobacteraceae bacterium]|nr:amino acid permease [Candidatus Baltobacteraceae bacterium]
MKPLARLLAEGSDETQPHSLKKTLGPVSLMAMGIGAIIGTGIFVLTGVAAATRSGPSLTLSFIVAGIASAFAALCYSEVATRIPIAGSAYTFAYASLGELIAWIIGWDLVLEYALGAATVSIGWSGYFVAFIKNVFGWVIPPTLQQSHWVVGAGGSITETTGVINLPAFAIICLIGMLLYRGTRESALFNNIVVTLKVCVVLFFIAVGVGHVNTGNWVPYFPFGITGMLGGAAFIFFAYIGFDAVSTSAEECKNPKRDLPIGIIGSLAICTVLYIIVVAILTGIVPYAQLNVASPVAFAMDHVGMGWASAIISIGAIAGLTTVLLVMMYGQTRVFFAMSRDGLLPAIFSKVHPKFRTPGLSTIIFTIFIALVAAVTPIGIVGALVNMGTLVAFILVSIALPIIRKKYPEATGFTVPGGPYLVPIISAVLAFGLIVSLKFGSPIWFGLPSPWLGFIVWTIVGLGIYFAYSRSHSTVGKDEAAA